MIFISFSSCKKNLCGAKRASSQSHVHRSAVRRRAAILTECICGSFSPLQTQSRSNGALSSLSCVDRPWSMRPPSCLSVRIGKKHWPPMFQSYLNAAPPSTLTFPILHCCLPAGCSRQSAVARVRTLRACGRKRLYPRANPTLLLNTGRHSNTRVSGAICSSAVLKWRAYNIAPSAGNACASDKWGFIAEMFSKRRLRKGKGHVFLAFGGL